VTLPDNRKNQQAPGNRLYHPVAVRRRKGYCLQLDLTPGRLNQFITGLLDQLLHHLDDAGDVSDRQTIINEARQYLRGANALCVSATIGELAQQGDYSGADGMAGLLNHMFEEGHARMDEIADEALSVFGWNGRSVEELLHTEH
jgi:hypothetical protein